MDGVAIGIDVGGTKLAAGLVAADGSILDRVRYETPRDGDEIVTIIAEVVSTFAAAHHVGAAPVGIGVAALVTADGGVSFAPNLPWTNFPLAATVRALLGVPVTVDNDANAAAWGEFRCGAGRGIRNSMVMLTVGTGVGGGLVLGERLVRGASGMAGELGHIAVLEGGPRCACGALGCLEAMASGTAVARMGREAVAAGVADGALGALPLDRITGKEVTIAASAGDAAAVEILTAAGRWLGIGIASLVAAFDPEIVVLGGGAMQAGHLLLDPAVAAAGERLVGRGFRTLAPIVPAALGDDAGLVGAALQALDGVRSPTD